MIVVLYISVYGPIYVVCFIVFVNCLLNEFAICIAVVAMFVLNVTVLLFVSVCFGETMYCCPEQLCVVSVIQI